MTESVVNTFPNQDDIHLCDVLIAGGGPIGLSLASELGRRGVSCIVIDEKDGFHSHPRATFLGPRTMEYFRMWGIDQQVLLHALPVDYPPDVVFTETMAGAEIGRLSYPSINQMAHRTAESLEKYPQLAWSRFAKVVIGQNMLEPLLFEASESYPNVQNTKGTRLLSFEQREDHVQAFVEGKSGSTEIKAQFLVGCDGGRSLVRKGLGATFVGLGEIGRSVNTYFDCPDLLKAIGKQPAAISWSLRPGATGAILAVDGLSKWVFSRYLLPGETFSESDDPSSSILAALGVKVELTVISSWYWTPRQLVSNSYGSGRVYLAGDSAHLMSPTGGYGLNTGIADVMNLGWRIAAVLKGWARIELLDSYELERRPMALRAAKEATDNRAFTRVVLETGGLLESMTSREHAFEFIRKTMSRHGKHFDGNGIYLGDRYDQSPIVSEDGSPPTPWDAEIYFPTTRPGGRLPLAWLDEHTTLHDVCGRDFTLFTQNAEAVHALQESFASFRVPLKVFELQGRCKNICQQNLIVRPDGIVAWRSADDFEPDEVVMRITALRAFQKRAAIPGVVQQLKEIYRDNQAST